MLSLLRGLKHRKSRSLFPSALALWLSHRWPSRKSFPTKHNRPRQLQCQRHAGVAADHRHRPTRNPTPISDVSNSITVVTDGEIEAQQERTLPDALEAVPGLNIVQTGGPGGLTSVYMRGTNANETKVLLDGIDVSDPTSTDDSFDFSTC